MSQPITLTDPNPSVVLYRDRHPAAQSVGTQPQLALELALGLDAAAAR